MKDGKCREVISKGARRERWKKGWEGYSYMPPWLLEFLVLTTWPMTYSFYLSFTDYSMFTAPGWVGLKSYIKMFIRDRGFLKAPFTMFRFMLMTVPLKLAFTLFIATHLNEVVKGMNLYRTFICLPSLLGGPAVVAVLWRNIFGIGEYINMILGTFGIEAVKWLTSPKYALIIIVLLNVWQFESSMAIFLAGLEAIPNSSYEAAGMDGAGTVHKLFKTMLPMISPVTFFNLVYRLIGTFQQFNSTFLITRGGPVDATYLHALAPYEKAFTSYQMGYAAGMAWILLGIVGCFTVVMFIGQKFWVFYENQRGGYLQWRKAI